MIPYATQNITKGDIKKVSDVLKSDFLTQGNVVPEFEKKLSQFTGARFAVCTNSATSALHISCLALNIKKDDIVWTSSNSYVASANCALYCGANVDFLDINSKTYNICLKSLKSKLRYAEKIKKLPKLLIVVHFSGSACEMEKIWKLSIKYNFKILEDASHAIGAKYNNEKIGNCRYSDVTVFSFHPVKIITTGEGGAALTNDSSLKKRMTLLRNHGVTKNEKEMINKIDGPWYYEQQILGYNFRMTDIQGALGISQLSRIKSNIAKRKKIATIYNELLSDLPVLRPMFDPDSAFHLYVIRLKTNLIKHTHLEVFNFLRKKGIGVNLHYIPIYKHPFYKSRNIKEINFPNMEQYYREAISFPMHLKLTKKKLTYITNILKIILLGNHCDT